ncbi:photosystem P840 reaction center protein PscD [Chloroherpeton thalassium ATCC 35110]|uniref:Photosystem P840 reaction center protein PscD n=1 Tax=Chloroherpeton thalassium (strain ATCC 35110 / GB-78) TaxID=517418 RepID=B3QZ39_CHLT3|nr:photosystem P840 reaction center protein PscD [Chloroherpeton thalassium]ACF13732.1 photosystem P840 reaction center protein PscD [Chloroherpeton thalassium ATCC 35110]
MSIWRTGNPVHKIDKYFITKAERDDYGRLNLTFASTGGYGQLTNIPEIKKLLKNHDIQVAVLSSNEDIAINLQEFVKSSEERYVTDFDGRGVRSTMREVQVFVNPNTDEMVVDINGRLYSLNEFFK